MKINQLKSFKMLKKRLTRKTRKGKFSVTRIIKSALRGLIPDVIALLLLLVLPFEVLFRAIVQRL